MKDGDGFMEAFEKALGISVHFYEEDFYRLMEEYLSKTGGEGVGNLEKKMEFWEDAGWEW